MVNETINLLNGTPNVLYNKANIIVSDGNLYLKSGSAHIHGWVLSYNEILITILLLLIISYLVYDKIQRIKNFE